MLANCNRSFHFGVSWAYYMTLVLFIKVSDCACFVNKGFLLLIGTIWKWEGKCSGCTQRWGKALRFSRLAKLVQFGAATADLGTGWPFISAGGWREREILFQEKYNLHVASRTRKESFKSRKLQIPAASELGLFMQMKYLCPQVCVLFCLVFFFFPILHYLLSISPFSGTGFHSCMQSHSHTDAIPCSKHWMLQGILVFLHFRSIFM